MTAPAAQCPWHRRVRQHLGHSIKWRIVVVFVLLATAVAGVFVFGGQRAFAVGWRDAARPLLADYVAHLASEVVAEAFHQFPAAGATGAIVLAAAPPAIHTWPELDAVTLDLYVCNHSRDNRAAAEAAVTALQLAFQAQRTVRRDVMRGGIGAAALTN